MLDKTGFDVWADGYDKDVGLSDESNTYPFAGYRQVLGAIYRQVMSQAPCPVLDLGFGTGTLTVRLYRQGREIWGLDFSPKMREAAQAKMPGAHLFSGDFTAGLPAPLRERQYGFIVSTYALHHLPDREKPGFLRELLPLLAPGGQILIGDVAFATRAQLEVCRAQAGEDWDEDEFYFVHEELRPLFPELGFQPLSPCAGVLSLPAETQ